MKVLMLAIVLEVLYRLLGRWLWRRWRSYGAADLPADLVRRSQ